MRALVCLAALSLGLGCSGTSVSRSTPPVRIERIAMLTIAIDDVSEGRRENRDALLQILEHARVVYERALASAAGWEVVEIADECDVVVGRDGQRTAEMRSRIRALCSRHALDAVAVVKLHTAFAFSRDVRIIVAGNRTIGRVSLAPELSVYDRNGDLLDRFGDADLQRAAIRGGVPSFVGRPDQQPRLDLLDPEGRVLASLRSLVDTTAMDVVRRVGAETRAFAAPPR